MWKIAGNGGKIEIFLIRNLNKQNNGDDEYDPQKKIRE